MSPAVSTGVSDASQALINTKLIDDHLAVQAIIRAYQVCVIHTSAYSFHSITSLYFFDSSLAFSERQSVIGWYCVYSLGDES